MLMLLLKLVIQGLLKMIRNYLFWEFQYFYDIVFHVEYRNMFCKKMQLLIGRFFTEEQLVK